MVVYGFGVVEFEEVAVSLSVDVDDREGGVGHPALLADGEGFDDGFDAFDDVDVVGHHGAEYLGGEGGEDAGFDAATEAVGEDESGVVAVDAAFDVVAAEFLTDVVEGGVAVFETKFHRLIPSLFLVGAFS